MRTRGITGVFFVLIMVGSHLLGKYVFLVFFTLLSLAGVLEFYKLLRSEMRKPFIIIGALVTLFSGVLVSLFSLEAVTATYFLLSIPAFSVVFVYALYSKVARPFHDIGYTFLGFVYAALPFLLFMNLGFLNGYYSYEIPLGFLILLWSNDTGAYLSGRSFGRRKLFERISPNKTWEGFFGGLLLTLVVALNLQYYFGGLMKWEWVVVALIVSVFGTLGDLVESMLKRSIGVKDSGNILPGHGGILDRFDGLLLAAPLVYVFLNLL